MPHGKKGTRGRVEEVQAMSGARSPSTGRRYPRTLLRAALRVPRSSVYAAPAPAGKWQAGIAIDAPARAPGPAPARPAERRSRPRRHGGHRPARRDVGDGRDPLLHGASATGSLSLRIPRFNSIKTESGSEALRPGYNFIQGPGNNEFTGVAKVSARDLQDKEERTSESRLEGKRPGVVSGKPPK